LGKLTNHQNAAKGEYYARKLGEDRDVFCSWTFNKRGFDSGEVKNLKRRTAKRGEVCLKEGGPIQLIKKTLVPLVATEKYLQGEVRGELHVCTWREKRGKGIAGKFQDSKDRGEPIFISGAPSGGE